MSFQTDFFYHLHFYLFLFVIFSGYLRPNAAGAWRKSPPQSSWCGRSSACTTSTASVAVYVTDSWGKGMSLYWRTDSCCARTTMRRRKTSSALSAPMTPIQVWIQANLYTTDHDASVFMNIFLGEFQKTFFVLYNTEEGLLKNASTVFCSYDECQNIDFYCMDRKH